MTTISAFVLHPPVLPSNPHYHKNSHPWHAWHSRHGSSKRRKRHHQTVLCHRPDHLPADAYTTLSLDNTPLCRLITSLPSTSTFASTSTFSPSVSTYPISSSTPTKSIQTQTTTTSSSSSSSTSTSVSPFPQPPLSTKTTPSSSPSSSSSSKTITTTTITTTSSSSPPSHHVRFLTDLVDAGFHTFQLPNVRDEISTQHFRDYVRFVGPSTARTLNLCTRVNITPSILSSSSSCGGGVNRSSVEAIVDKELNRFGVERIHLFQLQWYDFNDPRYIEFLGELNDLKQRGKIRSVGTLNFPTTVLKHLQTQQISIVSNSISFSLVDSRATKQMTTWSNQSKVALLAEHPLALGLINERFLGLPQPSKRASSTTIDLKRIVTIIQLWGGWSLFQELLYTVKHIADKYETSMHNIAIKWALQQPAFSSVLVDMHIGVQPHLNHFLDVIHAFHFTLEDDDINLLNAVLKKGNDLHEILGDCGHEFQPHSRII